MLLTIGFIDVEMDLVLAPKQLASAHEY